MARSKGNVNRTDERHRSEASDVQWRDANVLWKIIRLGRPKFLVYSLACHSVGVAYARAYQDVAVDWSLFAALQFTIWITHVMTHYINEYADVEVDRMNENATSWTGGSKVLARGWLPTMVAAVCGIVCLGVSFCAGVFTVWRYLARVPGLIPEDILQSDSWSSFASLCTPSLVVELMLSEAFPRSFVALGFSVLAVAIAYSLPPLHLSANALGELAVSYVLTFATPAVGLLIQGGHIDALFLRIITPFFLVSTVRMMVMNIPDRAGDMKGGKITSVVLLGEERAVLFHNVITLCTYALIVPQLQLPTGVAVAYYVTLPFRWWQQLRLNSPEWWRTPLSDSIPFAESLFVLATATSLTTSLYYYSS